jgi:2,4-dienoyl-CoA reductase (NADPH2)
LRRNGINPHIIGGADVAAELDAKRAIRQGTELAARL